MTKRKNKKNFLIKGLVLIFKLVKWILSSPFYLANFIIKLTKKTEAKVEKKKIEKRRESVKSKYEKFKILKTIEGNFDAFEKNLSKSDSTIGIVLGSRGSGKSAVALKIFENLYNKTNMKLYSMGFKSEEMPSWIENVDSIGKIKNNSHILIDEGGILFNSRKSMSSANNLLSELILVARHKNLSILFISQNSSNLEINILRQADYLILKRSSLLQKSFERKIIMDLYKKTDEDFKKLKEDKGLAYIHSDNFQGFISNSLPSFWNTSISKSWKGN